MCRRRRSKTGVPRILAPDEGHKSRVILLALEIEAMRLLRSSHLLITVASAVATVPGPTLAQPPAGGDHPVAPVSLWGVRVGAPLDTALLGVGRCMSGSEFAHVSGTYSRISDDFLFGLLPHEHNDSIPVLRVLDSVQVCIHAVPTSGATAFVTIMDSLVVHALFMWTDPAERPSVDSLGGLVAELYGEPDVHERGLRRWSADSVDLSVENSSRLGQGVTITLSDARGCEQFERLVHRGESRQSPKEPTRNRCWEQVSLKR